MIFSRPFQQVTRADLDELLSNKIREDRRIDYKQQLPTRPDTKHEFLCDLSSLANASGGYLIFGVEEEHDDRKRRSGLPAAVTGVAGIDVEAEIRRLESLARYSIQPRIPGIRFRVIREYPIGPVILVQVPRSWAAPHMVRFAGRTGFYGRDNRGRYELSLRQLRWAFLRSDWLASRVRNFRSNRLARIRTDETPIRLDSKARAVLHLIPISAFEPGAKIDLQAFRNNADWRPPGWEWPIGWGEISNFDGCVRWNDDRSYIQLFREGQIEAVVTWFGDWSGKNLWWPALERQIVELLRGYLQVLAALGTEPPLFCSLSFLGIGGYRILSEAPGDMRVGHRIERNDLVLPGEVLEDFSVDAASLLRPSFDALWQSAGAERSWSYDEEGRYLLDGRERILSAQVCDKRGGTGDRTERKG